MGCNCNCNCSSTTTLNRCVSSSCGCACANCCDCEETVTENCDQVCTSLIVSNTWNIPACDSSAVLSVPGLTSVLIGSYITNPTYGTFKITAFDSVNEQLTVLNECFAGNATPGSVVPALTQFIFGIPPTLTTWNTWTPSMSAQGAMTVSAVSANTADYFTLASTIFFTLNVSFTLAGVASNMVYFTPPVAATPFGIPNYTKCFIAPAGTLSTAGVWQINSANEFAVFLYGGAPWTLGAGSIINIQGFYQSA